MSGNRLLVVLAIASSVAFSAHAEIVGQARVVDGDTLDAGGQRIRLHGIDAPESHQACTVEGRSWNCGEEATAALVSLTAGHEVRCQERDRDRYGRIVAVCFVGSTDLNAEMVRKGWALAYRQYALDYVADEDRARQARAGIWRGEFTPPWEWRAEHRVQASQPVPAPSKAGLPTTPGECLIKGNISSKGERIYHVPRGRWYGHTKIDTGKGERWFCTEAEARAAGWRPSRQ